MSALVLITFWLYSILNPIRLLSIDAIGAGLFVVLCGLTFFIGVRKIKYDGKSVTFIYGFGYRRKFFVSEIQKIEFQDREQNTVVLLVYFKNGEKFSRGITGIKAKPFAEKLSALFT